MRIAFYAPLKPPGHPVPSGERLMARLLINALRSGGHQVELASQFRSYMRDPDDLQRLLNDARDIRKLLIEEWTSRPSKTRPQVWFAYHPYYKAPDLIGPGLARDLGLAYVTAEASYAGKRDKDAWAGAQARVAAGIRQAAVNFCMTGIDREGLARLAGEDRLHDLPPFIDTSAMSARAFGGEPRDGPCRLITVAMMRHGAKLRSYRMLATALADLPPALDWHLRIIGDGPARGEVEAAFAKLGQDRIAFAGQLPGEAVIAALSESDLFVWPGIEEAYGLAYLEAQACGLPVIACNTAGVPYVVKANQTGLLTPVELPSVFTRAVAGLIAQDVRRKTFSAAAHRFVHGERNLVVAARRLNDALLNMQKLERT